MKILTFLLNGFTLILSAFIGYDNGWKRSLHLVIGWKIRLEH